jgi:hypothetical protein
VLPSAYHAYHAQAAFTRAVRARRRAAFMHRLRGGRADDRRLAVFDEGHPGARRVALSSGRREIPLDAIFATTEPNRAAQFDADFRPTKQASCRWQRVWAAELNGVILPPVSVVPVKGGFALRDGHHRVSVARARGAVTIDAIVAA